MAVGQIEAMEQELINLQQDAHGYGGSEDDDADIKRASANEEPLFNDQFQVFQQMQDDRQSEEDSNGAMRYQHQPGRHELTPDQSEATESHRQGGSSRYARGAGHPA